MKKHLTSASIEKMRPPASGQIDVFDAGFPGLSVRISYAGRRSFVYHYRKAGKSQRLTLGTFPAMSLADAREAWRAARGVVTAGGDPSAGAPKLAQAPTFAEVLADWLARDQKENRTRDDVARLINKDVTPAWSTRPITDIGRRDVLDVLDAIVDRGSTITANRVYAHLHRLFRWSVGRGILATNPMADAPKPSEEHKRTRKLSDAELLKVWQAAATLGRPFGAIVQLLILTGARRSEISALRWFEVDDVAIKLEGDRTKNNEPHIIPLSRPAQDILADLPRGGASGELVFSDERFASRKKPVSGWSKMKRRLDALCGVEGWTLHDIRRTVATGLQRLGVALPVTEACLGHISGSRGGIVGVYQVHDFADEKRAALEAWGAHVEALIHGRARGKVVTLRRRARR